MMKDSGSSRASSCGDGFDSIQDDKSMTHDRIDNSLNMRLHQATVWATISESLSRDPSTLEQDELIALEVLMHGSGIPLSTNANLPVNLSHPMDNFFCPPSAIALETTNFVLGSGSECDSSVSVPTTRTFVNSEKSSVLWEEDDNLITVKLSSTHEYGFHYARTGYCGCAFEHNCFPAIIQLSLPQ